MVGRPESGVMVCTPDPEILNVIVSAPTWLLASVIAWRNEPVPISFVLVTENVEATTGLLAQIKNKAALIKNGARVAFLLRVETFDELPRVFFKVGLGLVFLSEPAVVVEVVVSLSQERERSRENADVLDMTNVF